MLRALVLLVYGLFCCYASPLQWLTAKTSGILQGCQEQGQNNTKIFTPDATGSYGAQWTRDFAYMVEGAPSLLSKQQVFQAISYTFEGQRGDGCIPDRMQTDGRAVYSPGATSSPFADHAIDNMPFSGLLLAAAMKTWPDGGLFCQLEPKVRKALDFVNRSETTGLVFNSVEEPNCTYGFTDTVAKSGELLFSSLLYFDASRKMAALAARFQCGDSKRYSSEASQIAASLDASSLAPPPGSPWFSAASVANRLPDVWGSLYLVSLNLTTPVRSAAILSELRDHTDTYVQRGQLRHLPYPMLWDSCFGGPCPSNGTYQNGAYWATPLGYLVRAALVVDNTARAARTAGAPAVVNSPVEASAAGDSTKGTAAGFLAFAKSVVLAAVADFEANGVYEDVDYGCPATSTGVLNYTASATNALAALQTVARTGRKQMA